MEENKSEALIELCDSSTITSTFLCTSNTLSYLILDIMYERRFSLSSSDAKILEKKKLVSYDSLNSMYLNCNQPELTSGEQSDTSLYLMESDKS